MTIKFIFNLKTWFVGFQWGRWPDMYAVSFFLGPIHFCITIERIKYLQAKIKQLQESHNSQIQSRVKRIMSVEEIRNHITTWALSPCGRQIAFELCDKIEQLQAKIKQLQGRNMVMQTQLRNQKQK